MDPDEDVLKDQVEGDEDSNEGGEPLDIDVARENLGLTNDGDGKIKEIKTEDDLAGGDHEELEEV